MITILFTEMELLAILQIAKKAIYLFYLIKMFILFLSKILINKYNNK